MTPERYQQIEKLYHAALALPPAPRQAFLTQACEGDADLQAEVESLLKAHAEAGSFIVQPAMEMAAEVWAQEKAQADAGRRIGPYQLLRLLGAGGMGEVHLAQDLRLHRKVALKLLPSQWTNDAERVRRFLQEAQAASALNHPNIITIYEVGQEQQAPYIASEFIDGQTLRQRLAEGDLTLQAVLDIALQVAAALAAAHEAGIIHRDIKPENIMVRRDGLVKVLDFGLAKPTAPLPALLDGGNANSTAPGVILGTLRYMSPEQGRGLRVDARTDIFSFGVLLYELLAGKLPFTGRTASDVLAALLTAEPAPLPESVPVELQRIVQQSLGKEPTERYQSATVLLTDLRRLKQAWERQLEFADENATNPVSLNQLRGAARPTAGGPGDRTGEPGSQSTNSTREVLLSGIKQHRGSVTAIALALCAALAWLGYGVWQLYKLSRQATSFQKMKLTKLTTNGKLGSSASAISPDGKYAAYVLAEGERRSLWVTHIPTGGKVQVGPLAPVTYDFPAFSPDNNYIYYLVRDEQTPYALYRISVLGGTPVKILDDIYSAVTFSPKTNQFAYLSQDRNHLLVANQDGTAIRKVATNRENGYWSNPVWSPDGQVIVCGLLLASSNEVALVTIRYADGAVQPLGSARWYRVSGLGWQNDSNGLFLSAADKETKRAQLWALTYPDGEPRRVTNDLSVYGGVSLSADSQQLVCVRNETLSNLWLVPKNDPSQAQQLTFEANKDGLNGLAWTPERHLVYSANNLAGEQDLWLLNPTNGERRQLTMNAGENRYPTVSPDGHTIVFCSNRENRSALWRMDLKGGNLGLLVEGEGLLTYPQYTPDGQWLVYQQVQKNLGTLWKVASTGGAPSQIATPDAFHPALSPDGQWLAHTYRDSPNGVPRLALVPLAGDAPKRLLELPTLANSILFRWMPEGQGLTYIDGRSRGYNLVNQPLVGGPAKPLTNFNNDLIYYFEWSRDGQWLALARGQQTTDLLLISGLNQ
jgi:serine/threonine protein kinase